MKSRIPYAVRETIWEAQRMGLLDTAVVVFSQWELKLPRRDELPFVDAVAFADWPSGSAKIYWPGGQSLQAELQSAVDWSYGQQVAVKGMTLRRTFASRAEAETFALAVRERASRRPDIQDREGIPTIESQWDSVLGGPSGRLTLRLNAVACLILRYCNS